MAIKDSVQLAEISETIKLVARGLHGDRHQRFVENKNSYFAHYTSTNAVDAIANSRCFLMRNTRLMNDQSEVLHGFQVILETLEQTKGGRDYVGVWNEVTPHLGDDLFRQLSQHRHVIESNCYVLSMCEHCEPEDNDGKLSMWRAYGHSDIRVAIIVRPSKLLQIIPDDLVATPVVYGDLSIVADELAYRAEVIKQNLKSMSGLSRDQLSMLSRGLTINFAVALKHMGFREEREWRYVYMGRFSTPQMEKRKQTILIGGVPQIAYQLPFVMPIDSDYDAGSVFLEKVLIGPCPEQQTVVDATAEMLRNFGFSDANSMVVGSSIPFRQSM